MIQSSFENLNQSPLVPTHNGFVDTCRRAYSEHQHLHIRPDDVWLAILTQVNLLVNANAETYRQYFVKHEGKKPLQVKALANSDTFDWAQFPLQISDMIKQSVRDPHLREWIVPNFPTTTSTDQVVASIAMMSTLQSYFNYSCRLRCGIPSVTLEGTQADWKDILIRSRRFKDFGPAAEEWLSLLTPVLSRCHAAFIDPTASENIDFWQKICHYRNGGSGPSYLSGWLTAFIFFDEKGKKLRTRGVERRQNAPQGLVLDGLRFHTVDTVDIPQGWVTVPIAVDDNGHKYKARMVAGSVGMQAVGNTEIRPHGKEEQPTIFCEGLRPAAGWWMYQLKEDDPGV